MRFQKPTLTEKGKRKWNFSFFKKRPIADFRTIRALFILAFLLLSSTAFLQCFLLGDDDDAASFVGPGDSSADYECLPDSFSLPATVQVERTAIGYTETIELEEYIKGVLPMEIGESFPEAAAKAQAVAARSYVVGWVRSGKGPVCDTAMCQVYGDGRYESTNQAVDETAGVIGFYDGDVIQAVYSASCGGHTENAQDVWGGYFDYLVARSCLENEICTQDCSDWFPVDEPTCHSGEAGCCYGRNGHGVGMCQRGAQAMAECGFTHEEILKQYYWGISLARPCEN